MAAEEQGLDGDVDDDILTDVNTVVDCLDEFSPVGPFAGDYFNLAQVVEEAMNIVELHSTYDRTNSDHLGGGLAYFDLETLMRPEVVEREIGYIIPSFMDMVTDCTNVVVSS